MKLSKIKLQSGAGKKTFTELKQSKKEKIFEDLKKIKVGGTLNKEVYVQFKKEINDA